MNILRLVTLPILGFLAGWFVAMQATPAIPPAGTSLPPFEVSPDSRNAASRLDQPAADSTATRRATPAAPLLSLRQAMACPSALHRLSALDRLLDNATPAQFSALYAELAAFQPTTLGDSLLFDLFFRRWAQVAPEAAVNASLGNHRYALYSALNAWAEHDPIAAVVQLDKLHLSHIGMMRSAIVGRGLPKPGEFPPPEAMRKILERLAAVGPGIGLANAADPILAEWAQTDPAAALQAAAAFPGGEGSHGMRQAAISTVIGKCVATDPQAVAPLIEALPAGPERTEAQQAYVSKLLASDHERIAKDYALALPDGPDRRATLAALAQAMQDRDRKPDAAGAFLATLPPADWQEPTAFARVIKSWLAMQPEQASEVLLAHLPPDIQLSKEDTAAYADMFFNWRDSKAASTFVLKLPDAVRDAALPTVLGIWCSMDVPAASQWAATLPAGASRDRALEQIAVSWTGRGAGEVTQWLDTLPADSGRNAAVEGFARTVMSVSPDDALAWLRTVPDETDRLARLRRVWQNWADRDAAQRWLDASTDLTAAERTALQK